MTSENYIQFLEKIFNKHQTNIIYLKLFEQLNQKPSSIDLLKIIVKSLRDLDQYDICCLVIDKYLSTFSIKSKELFLECIKYAYCSHNTFIIQKYKKRINEDFFSNLEKPLFNEKQILLDQQLNTYQNRPLFICFQGFLSRIVEDHYIKYKTSNLEKLNNSLIHGGMSLFIKNNIFNLIHVKDDLQVYYLLNREKFISILKEYIKNLHPSHIITFGSSAGGTAALAFGEFLEADMALAFSPQTICFDLYINRYRKDMNENYHLMLEEGSVITNISTFYTSKCKKIIFVGEKNTQDISQLNIIKQSKNIIINKIKDVSSHSIITEIGKEKFLYFIINYVNALIENKELKVIEPYPVENLTLSKSKFCILTSLIVNSNFINFLILNGDLQGAKDSINAVLLNHDEWAEGYKELSLISLAQKNNEDAIFFARKAIKMDSSKIEYKLCLIDILIKCKNFNQAICEIYNCLSLYPDSGDSYHKLAVIYEIIKKIDISIAIERLALAIDPNNKWSRVHLIFLLLEKNELTEANNVVNELIRIHSGWGISYRQLSYVYNAKGELDKAISAAQKAFDLDPNGPSIKSNLNKLLQQKMDLKINQSKVYNFNSRESIDQDIKNVILPPKTKPLSNKNRRIFPWMISKNKSSSRS